MTNDWVRVCPSEHVWDAFIACSVACEFGACKAGLVRFRAMSARFPDQSERSAAIRNLKRLNKVDARVQVDDDFVSKYLALRQMRGELSRITISMLLGRDTKVVKTNKLKQQLWKIYRRRRPNLPHEIEPTLFVDPNLMEQKPPGINMEDVWVLDQACPQSAICAGAFQWETSVSMQIQAPLDVDTDTDTLAQPTHDECFRNATTTFVHGLGSQSTSAPPSSMNSHGNSVPPSPVAPRLLCKSNSEPHEVEDMFEGIARATKAALEAGRYFSDDLHDTSTIEFWLRSYVAHLRAAHDQFAASIARASDSSPLAGSQDGTFSATRSLRM